MRLPDENATASERRRDEFYILQELGFALRRSFQSIDEDPPPSKIALLLMQLALAEIVRKAAKEERETR